MAATGSPTAIRSAALVVAMLGLAALVVGPSRDRARAQGEAPAIPLAPHRAIYDLKLKEAHGQRSLQSARGRIVYDFSGTACDGYALKFRQVTELDSGEGKIAVSDLRSETWEEGAAKSFRFASQSYTNDELVDSVDGRADRGANGVVADLNKPSRKTVELGDVVFPAQHMRRVIATARAGTTLLEQPIFDGSETGEKVYNTLTVIGRQIAPESRPLTDVSAKEPVLAAMARWPVTISYFDRGKAGDAGEQTPVYSIKFELFENGISRSILLDYGDFSISGEMTSLDLKEPKPCK
jgi:hypothetical protein